MREMERRKIRETSFSGFRMPAAVFCHAFIIGFSHLKTLGLRCRLFYTRLISLRSSLLRRKEIDRQTAGTRKRIRRKRKRKREEKRTIESRTRKTNSDALLLTTHETPFIPSISIKVRSVEENELTGSSVGSSLTIDSYSYSPPYTFRIDKRVAAVRRCYQTTTRFQTKSFSPSVIKFVSFDDDEPGLFLGTDSGERRFKTLRTRLFI